MDVKQFFVSIIVSGTLLSGCASTSVFNPYPNQAANYKTAIRENTIEKVTLDLAKKSKNEDALLYFSERGRLNQLNKNYAESKTDFEKVIAAYDALDEKAKISASSIAANASTMLTNDNAIPYTGFGYERILAHQFQAFNYLALGNLEGANVEIRRAALEQRILELAHEKEIANAENEAGGNDVNLADFQNTPELAGMNKLVGSVKNSFQNAYTFYTSAVLWEAQGDFNNATVDYKKALEINPNNEQIKADVLRVSAGKILPANQGALVVLFEDGFVPERQGFNLSIPYFGSSGVTYISAAFPYYSADRWYAGNTLTLYNNNSTLGQTQEVANFGAMAVKALKEKVPAMIVRQVIRARAKYESNKVASEQGGIIGSILSTVYNIVSEQADLRSWLTLPNNAQVLRTQLPTGEQAIELNVAGVSQNLNLTIHSGRITVLRVINIHNRFITETFYL